MLLVRLQWPAPGRPVGLEILRQFGLVDSELADSFLNSAFASSGDPTEPPKPGLGKVQNTQAPQTPCSEQSNRTQ